MPAFALRVLITNGRTKTEHPASGISPMARYGQDLEIPADQISGRDLCAWHVVTVECGNCLHGRVVDHRLLKRGNHADKLSGLIDWKCEWCGKTSADVRHTVRVVKLPRNF
jgi:hypothetical protein